MQTATRPLERERAQLLARIRREFDIVEETLAFGRIVLPFVRIADPDALLGDICDQVDLSERGIAPRRELRMPYWAAVWESATALAEHLVERDGDEPLAGARALDLGCGTGLVGAAMAALGACVTLGDIDTASLLFARLNTLAWSERASVVRCDWSSGDLGQRFDLITGADLIYDVDQWGPIEAFARHHLAPGGQLLLGEPSRLNADSFPDWLASRGWTLASSERAAGERVIRIHQAAIARPR